MSFSLFVLALSAFAIGTTEFVIMGLLPEVATDLSVSIPSAGWLITGYALGVAIGAPFMALLTARLPRRQALIILMGIFILGNLLCALAWGYSSLMLARVVTSLCHGAFFGIGAVTAANLVAPDKRASAVAMMFTGLTLANVLGVPLGTALGQEMGWRSTFLAVAVIGVIALFGLVKFLPKGAVEEPVSIRSEFAALRHIKLWIALFTTVMFSASMFALFTYIAPLLRDVTGVSPRWVTLTLFLIGIGLTIGNVVGGKLGDQHLKATLSGAFLTLGLTTLLFSWTSHSFIPAEINLFLWAVAAFSLVPALQINVVNYGKDAPNLTSTLNIGAFNVGNALGAWVGGIVLTLGYGLTMVPIAAGLLALVGFGLTIIGRR
ncbi:MFS transporter [Polynucleobacter sp. MWH-Spelu-300-X4]|uniref:MFS transporter n=1 Tax=Polynucleobacter sp. MWH-Spelu-300-X4 TaxID=2689109 RepID=UPI001BFD335D|nr:MFS transporter [Polynucleobacter sp. MWH-Spelu-300-X4]QWD79184.1 MFS transporter [Polynucleobacter sp. MWH-Spelu-300-X4]